MNLKNEFWEVRIHRDVEKDMKFFPLRDKQRILLAFEEIGVNPYSGNIKKMKGEDTVWRRRSGSYRIFYELGIHERLIIIFRVERRTSTTY